MKTEKEKKPKGRGGRGKTNFASAIASRLERIRPRLTESVLIPVKGQQTLF
jgi:hypothetical protein